MKVFSVILGLVFLVWAGPVFAGADPIGSIKDVEGQAYIIRDGNSIPATTGTRIFENDTLKTLADSSLGVVFRDNGVISLGPKTEIVLDEFVFAPSQNKFSMIARMLKGTAAYLSGLMVKLSPDSARVETPVASIGFRGTKCLIRAEGS